MLVLDFDEIDVLPWLFISGHPWFASRSRSRLCEVVVASCLLHIWYTILPSYQNCPNPHLSAQRASVWVDSQTPKNAKDHLQGWSDRRHDRHDRHDLNIKGDMTCNALKPHEVCFPLFSHRLYLTLSGIQRISPVHLETCLRWRFVAGSHHLGWAPEDSELSALLAKK